MEEQTVENQTNQMDSVQVPVTVSEKKSNTLLIVILLIVILLIGGGGVYAGMQLGKKQNPPIIPPQTESPTSIPTQVVQPTSVVIPLTSTPDATANWKTYTDTSYNFSFRYPNDFVYEINDYEGISEVTVKEKDKLRFQVKGMRNYPVGQKEYLLDTSSNGQKTIDNVIWKIYSLPKGYCDMGGCTPPIFGLQTEHSGALYSIFFYGQSSGNEFSDQILSTFKFLE